MTLKNLTYFSINHPKLVIAYIDIGEAEDYRTYWQPGWGVFLWRTRKIAALTSKR